jgi:immunoglobulin heavy chain
MGAIWGNGNTHYNPTHKSHLSINRDTSRRQVSLTVSSLKTEDTAIYYCARDAMMGLECEPRKKPPCRGNQDQQGVVSKH